MRLPTITIRICCMNCRHRDKDERTAYRFMRRKIQGVPPIFCPEKGVDEKICEKFLPRKDDLRNAIWRARESANTKDEAPQ